MDLILGQKNKKESNQKLELENQVHLFLKKEKENYQ